MSNEQAKQVLQNGIAAARAGQQAQARLLLQEAVKRDPRSEVAWLWLSSVAKDNQERIFCLKQLLSLNPNNEHAIKGLKALGVSTETAAQPASTIPVVDEKKLGASMQQVDAFLGRYQPVPTATLPFNWMKKKRGRVGDQSAAILRFGAIVGVVIVVGLLLAGAGVLVSRLGGTRVVIVFTPTVTPTPSNTPTATPGATDTPSPTPRTSSTPPPTPAFPKGSVYSPTSTPVYPDPGGSGTDIQRQIQTGKLDDAIAFMEKQLRGITKGS